MKRNLLKLFALTCAMFVNATTWAQELSIDDFSIEAGETKQVTLDLIQGSLPVLGFQCDLELSDGLVLQRIKAVTGTLPDDQWGDPQTPNVTGEGARILVYNDKDLTIKTDAKAIVTLYIQANSEITNGTIKIKDVAISCDNNGAVEMVYPAEKTTKVNSNEAPTAYAITVAECENGSVTVNKNEASAGETIQVSVKPNEGYELGKLIVKFGDTDANEINADYTFTMPASDVSISATFKKIESTTGDPFLNIEDFEIGKGETKQVTLNIVPGTDKPVLGFQCDLELPDGLTLQRIKAVEGTLPNDQWGDPQTPNVTGEGARILVYNDKDLTIRKDAKAIVTLYIAASSDFEAGVIKIKEAAISCDVNGEVAMVYPGDKSVRVNNPVGISGIKANTTTEAYTLSGTRVRNNNLQRGLYIINGKKVVVK
jgi:predicted ribosome-associated RNA-binding protein Tma20